jgi:hypothetical protein
VSKVVIFSARGDWRNVPPLLNPCRAKSLLRFGLAARYQGITGSLAGLQFLRGRQRSGMLAI